MRAIHVYVEVDGDILTDAVRLKVPDDAPEVIVLDANGKPHPLTLKRRYCNRCNKAMWDIQREPRCDNCRNPEFRLMLPALEEAQMKQWKEAK